LLWAKNNLQISQKALYIIAENFTQREHGCARRRSTQQFHCYGLSKLIEQNIMYLSYDSEGDVLEVIFDEELHRADQIAYKLRLGIVLYLTADAKQLVQLTLVSYRALAEFPVIHFEGWNALSKSDRALLTPLLKSPAISAFLRIDPQTGDGHIASPNMLEALPLAA